MGGCWWVWLVIALFGVSGALAFDRPSASSGLSSMKWLAGTWEGPRGTGTFRAYYSTPEGGKILSYSELLQGEKVVFHEFERFDLRDGVVTLQPFPGGRSATAFKLTELAGTKATFENPKNDFPSRLVYERIGDQRLVITLTAPHTGSDKKQVYDLRRPPKG